MGLVASPSVSDAFTVHVIAASELQLEPRLSPDRSSLTVSVRLHNDRAAPMAGREVALSIRSLEEPAGIHEEVTVRVGDGGAASHVVPVTAAQHMVRVSARYVGDATTAPRSGEIMVNLDAPYVTVDVVPPTGGVNLGDEAARFTLGLRVGEVVGFPAGDQTIELREGTHELARARTDAGGRAMVLVPGATFGVPGVHRVRAVTSVNGELIEGPQHEVLVRARTTLTLVRGESDEPDASTSLVGALTTTTGAPVRDAAVRIVRGVVTLAGARTDAEGHFRVRLGLDVLAEAGVTARAVFEPTEPWYVASESATLALTSPPPPKVHWLWGVGSVAVAAAVVTAMTAKALRRDRTQLVAEPLADGAWDHVEHVAPMATHERQGLRVRFVVSDRATGAKVNEPMVRWGGVETWVPTHEGPHTVQPARKVEFEVGASGYCPRKVVGEFSRPGEYLVRVQLRTWREELFERARPWLKRVSTNGGALVTLREALKTRAPTPEAVAFVTLVEEGCYAPSQPGVREVEQAEAMAPVTDLQPDLRRD
jgi:hypothetical protein